MSSRANAALRSALVAALGAAVLACDDPPDGTPAVSVIETMATADTSGYARAVAPRPFSFPTDHGPHPDYRTEWWYFTGNLMAEDGREFGFQLTFFRSALRPRPGDVESPWATRQAYMAHFAVADVEDETFHAHERFDRGALGLAGATGPGEGSRVWVGDWEARLLPGDEPAFQLRAADSGTAVDLIVRATQPVVLQGRDGLSPKGPEPGNASYYYSLVRMAADGTVTVDGTRYRVDGEAWLDREWSTSALGADLAGWDWFSIQLDDQSELMLYRLRTSAGGSSPFSAGTFIGPKGSVTRLDADAFELRATGSWTSPRGGRYPSGWVIRVPGESIELRVEPRLRDQELPLAFRYWEGAVSVRGMRRGAAVTGRGYVELTGYAEAGGRDTEREARSTRMGRGTGRGG